MNTNPYKLQQTRDGNGAMVMILSTEGKEVFATSRGYQLGCALHALNVEGPNSEGVMDPHTTNDNGTFLEHTFGESAEEREFWAGVFGALGVKALLPHAVDPEYALVSCLLPGQLVKVPFQSFADCPKEELLYMMKSIHFPSV